MTIVQVMASILMVAGVLVAGIASVGLVRFPDVLSRMHAASKPQTFGLILFMIGVAVAAKSWAIAGMLLLVVLVQLLTITAASAMVGRAAFRRGFVSGGQYVIDELSPRLAVGQTADDDDDGFIDNDPQGAASPDGVDISEPLPTNTLTDTTGLELADLKQYWDEEEESEFSGDANAHPKTGEFRSLEGKTFPKH